jgi:hypothetical protein
MFNMFVAATTCTLFAVLFDVHGVNRCVGFSVYILKHREFMGTPRVAHWALPASCRSSRAADFPFPSLTTSTVESIVNTNVLVFTTTKMYRKTLIWQCKISVLAFTTTEMDILD